MPRTSQAALAVTCIGLADRLAPPAELGEAEARVFRQTVATVADNHFLPEDLPLLCSYARAVVLERRAGEQLAALVEAGEASSDWVRVYSCAAKTLLALGGRLRIGPMSRSNHNRRSPGKPGAGSLSYYETMDLPGGEDAAETESS